MKVVNKRTYLPNPQLNAVYIGRGSPWGNPFKIGKDGTRDEVIAKYRDWIGSRLHLIRMLRDRNADVLVCYCAPLRCHGDVLVELVEAL